MQLLSCIILHCNIWRHSILHYPCMPAGIVCLHSTMTCILPCLWHHQEMRNFPRATALPKMHSGLYHCAVTELSYKLDFGFWPEEDRSVVLTWKRKKVGLWRLLRKDKTSWICHDQTLILVIRPRRPLYGFNLRRLILYINSIAYHLALKSSIMILYGPLIYPLSLGRRKDLQSSSIAVKHCLKFEQTCDVRSVTICTFNNKDKSSFARFAREIHVCTFRSRSRANHDVKWPVFSVSWTTWILEEKISF